MSNPQITRPGHIDLTIIPFQDSHFDGDVTPALMELAYEEGIVHIIDCSLVRKGDDGRISVLEVADPDTKDAFARVAHSELDLLSNQDLDRISEGLDSGSSALVVVWENSWTGDAA